MTWRVQVRRFRCRHCPGQIFAERVPGLGACKARRSDDRLAEAQTDIGMVLGGEAGARLSRRLAMLVSGDTMLRLIRRHRIVPSAPPRVVGIDDWDWRRGRSYGTLVCDRWRHEYGGLQIDQARRMKDLERENARLRRLVADLSLVGQVLADVASGNL